MPTPIVARMTLAQVMQDMRRRGLPISQNSLSTGIQNGTFPFAKVVSVGETGRRTFFILSTNYHAWAAENLGPYLKEESANA